MHDRNERYKEEETLKQTKPLNTNERKESKKNKIKSEKIRFDNVDQLYEDD